MLSNWTWCFENSDIVRLQTRARKASDVICSSGPVTDNGPVYNFPAPKNCTGEAVGVIASAATSIYNYASTAAGAACKAALNEAFASYAAGEATAAEFVAAAVAALSAPELAAALGSAAVAISLAALLSALLVYFKCENGG